MRRSVIGILVLLALIASVGCKAASAPVESVFVIKITGRGALVDIGGTTYSIKVEFTGNYTVTTADGHSTSQSVDGAVPAQYTVSGTAMSCVFQNKGKQGSLDVTVTKDGSPAGFATTAAAYGVVSVTIP